MNNNWSNKQIVGFMAGIIVPFLTTYIIYRIRYFGGRSFIDFIDAMLTLNSFGKLLSLSVVPNLLLFFMAIWTDRLMAARGVLVATVLFGIVMLIITLIG